MSSVAARAKAPPGRAVTCSGRTGDPDPSRRHVGSQFVDVHPGHGVADCAQQSAGQILGG
jgi:hypothetical protein